MSNQWRDAAGEAAAFVAAMAVPAAYGQNGGYSLSSVSTAVTQSESGSSSMSISSVTVGHGAQAMDARVVNGIVWIDGVPSAR